MSLPYQFKVDTLIQEGRTTRSAIDSVKNWSKTTTLPHLQEEFILVFLISCENDVEAAKRTIEAYFRIRQKTPEIFSNLDPYDKDVKKMMQVVDACVIPRRMDNNSVVIIAKLNDTNFRSLDFGPLLKTSAMILLATQVDDPPKDAIIVIDLEGVNFMHLTKIRFGIAVAFLEYIQNAMPLKIQRIHILNSNYVYHKAISLFSLFIKSELLQSIVTHSQGMNLKHFHQEYIPKRYLPEEYGGELPSIKEMWKNTVSDFNKLQHFFREEEKLRSYYRT